MTQLAQPETPAQPLNRESFTAAGQPVDEATEIEIVKNAWAEAESYLGNEASYKLEWVACRTSYRSPRPYMTWGGSFVLQPNLRRFDVAKWVNSIVSQVMKSYFAEEIPLVITPGPNMTPDSAQAWQVLLGRLLKESGPGPAGGNEMPAMAHGFKEEFKLLVEQWALCGTGMAMYYVQEEEQCFRKRKSSQITLPASSAVAAAPPAKARKVGPPEFETHYKAVKRMKFKFIDLGADECVVWQPSATGSDVRMAGWVIGRWMVDFYELQQLALDQNYDIPGAKLPEGRTAEGLLTEETDEEIIVGGSLIDLFFGDAETDNRLATPSATGQAQSTRGNIHQAKPEALPESNPLRRKLEILQYLDQSNNQVISLLQRKKVIRRGPADFGFLSANYWNLPAAIHGIGIGQIGSNNQQLGQWIVNSALKNLALALNMPFLAPDTIGQSPRVLSIGSDRVLTVSEQMLKSGGMQRMEGPKIPPEIWPVLQESNKEGESATGADAMLVQGSSAGPRAGMGRTGTGANIMAGASDARLDGPMDNLTQQVFLSYIAAEVWFVFNHMSDHEILEILGDELGPEFVQRLDLENFHNAKFDYDVLLGAKLGALRALAQSLVLVFEYGMNPEMQQFLADVHGKTIDLGELYKLLLRVSHCPTGVAASIVRNLTPKELKLNQQKQAMAAQQGPGGKLAQIQAQGAVDSSIEDQKIYGRMVDKVVDNAAVRDEISGADGAGA